ncbi:hypothetical protein D0Z00_000022 [Geotrichum galactomycetum]|uniref:Uncharacterized protein n=1 Tax=Geotrichum galactomycetum TaxID=27317 RepID=A0ACB6VAU7_9ASCO|nr:hypothetical protein D0Z00_000022 [Geotrichum candidum]
MPDSKMKNSAVAGSLSEGQQQQQHHQQLQPQQQPGQPPVKSGSVSGASSGTKVNQSVFIHKLYSMLEDDSIKHLISWTPTNDSFIISPGEEFSKVLSQYFKHTNPSSFVRQLNMYGFHKVNDTFHGTNSANASSEGSTATTNATSQWEFKHGAGSFKRGDVEALRAIKRRASRPSAVHRDNISLKPVSLSVPSTPPADYGTPPPAAGPSIGLQQPIPGHPHPQSYLPQHHTVPYYPPPDNNVDARLASLENSLWTLKSSHHTLVSKYNNLVDNCKRTQLESLQLVDSLVKNFSDSPKAKSEPSSNISFTNELAHLRTRLQMHNTALTSLIAEEQPHYLSQYNPQFSQQAYHPHPHHPHTKTEISFTSSSRERATSIFYDPLAPAPHPTSPRQQIEEKLIPTSAPLGSTVHLHRQSAPGGFYQGSPNNSTPSSPTPRHSELHPHYQPQHQPQPPQQQPQQQPPQQQPPSQSYSQPQSPKPSQYYAEAPPSPQGHLLSSHAPTRDQRPGSFPFVSSYHHQRQQFYGQGNTMGGSAGMIPSSNPYGGMAGTHAAGNGGFDATSGTNAQALGNALPTLSNASKLRAETMAPYRRHTSSELISNSSAVNGMLSISQQISMTTPPDTSSRHNSNASTNSVSSAKVAATTATASNTTSSSSPFTQVSPSKPAPTLTIEPPSSRQSSDGVSVPVGKDRSGGRSVMSLLNPTTQNQPSKEAVKKEDEETSHVRKEQSTEDEKLLEPERKRLKVV